MSSFSAALKALRTGRHLTQEELAVQIGISKSAVSMYECGEREPDFQIQARIADFFQTSIDALHGRAGKRSAVLTGRQVPLLGRIACGSPILAEENIEAYVPLPDGIRADYCLRCCGDSMINARILDGDLVLIRQQEEVEQGEIAAVLLHREATLKRVYLQEGKLTLMPENSKYPPIVLEQDDLEDVRILGKAVAFISRIV